MTERAPEIQHKVTSSVTDGKVDISCAENEHPDPKIGHEFVCTDANGKQTYTNWPRTEKHAPKKKPTGGIPVGRAEVDDGIFRHHNSFDTAFRIDALSPMLGYTNQKGDLLVDKELTNGRKVVILKSELETNAPPLGSYKVKLDPNTDMEVVMTPEGSVWTTKEFRKLSYDEAMNLIITKLQSIDKKRGEKIGPMASVENNLSVLEERIMTA